MIKVVTMIITEEINIGIAIIIDETIAVIIIAIGAKTDIITTDIETFV